MRVAAETHLDLRASIRTPGFDLIATVRRRPVEADLIAGAAHARGAADQGESSGISRRWASRRIGRALTSRAWCGGRGRRR